MNQPVINDPRARFWGNVAKYGAVLVAGFLVAPYIWVAIGGLIGLIVAVVVILAAWMLRPVAFSFAANMRLKLIKSEAAKNPVETLQNDLKDKAQALAKRDALLHQAYEQSLHGRIGNHAIRRGLGQQAGRVKTGVAK